MRFYPFIFLVFLTACEPGGPGSKPDKKVEVDPESIKSFKEIELDAYFKVEIPIALDKTTFLNKDVETQYFSFDFQFGLLILNENLNGSKKGMLS